jgi:hypothetical protein
MMEVCRAVQFPATSPEVGTTSIGVHSAAATAAIGAAADAMPVAVAARENGGEGGESR